MQDAATHFTEYKGHHDVLLVESAACLRKAPIAHHQIHPHPAHMPKTIKHHKSGYTNVWHQMLTVPPSSLYHVITLCSVRMYTHPLVSAWTWLARSSTLAQWVRSPVPSTPLHRCSTASGPPTHDPASLSTADASDIRKVHDINISLCENAGGDEQM